MTSRHASKIVDAEVDVFQKGDIYCAECNLQDIPVVIATVSVSAPNAEQAIRMLVDECYRVRCQYIAKQQRFRCLECDSIRPLEFDHIQKRSQNRLDAVRNLRGLCSECHRRRHGG